MRWMNYWQGRVPGVEPRWDTWNLDIPAAALAMSQLKLVVDSAILWAKASSGSHRMPPLTNDYSEFPSS